MRLKKTKVKALTILFITLFTCKIYANSCCENDLQIEFQDFSTEAEGILILPFNVIHDDGGNVITIDSIIYFVENNEGISIVSNSLSIGSFQGENPTTFNLEISYDANNTPFYLQELRMYVYANDRATLATTYLFFSPWGEIQIYNPNTLPNDIISWLSPVEGEVPVRSEINPDTIPNTVPDTTLPMCWKYYDGLAYAVLVNCNEDPEPEPEFVKTFRGRAKGRLVYTYRNDNAATVTIPIANARVEAWSGFRIGVGSTDNNGYFNFDFDKTIFNTSGNIQVRLKFKTKDNAGEVEVHYNSAAFGINTAYTMETSSKKFNHQSGNRHDLNFLTQRAGSHRNLHVFHWAKRSIDFATAELHGLPIPWAKLLVFVPSNPNSIFNQTRDGCFFRHNTFAFIGAPAQGKIHMMENRCIQSEHTTYHEVGHFVQFAIQNRRWAFETGGTHALTFNNKHPNQTILEGFANGFAMIVDTRYFTDDNETFQ